MPGGYLPGAQLSRSIEKKIEFEPAVAADTWAGGAAMEIVSDEGIDDLPGELLVHSQGVVGNSALLSDAFGVAQIEGAAAAAMGLLVRAIPQQHGQANDWLALLCQEPGCHRRIQSAAHGYGSHPLCADCHGAAAASRRSSST